MAGHQTFGGEVHGVYMVSSWVDKHSSLTLGPAAGFAFESPHINFSHESFMETQTRYGVG